MTGISDAEDRVINVISSLGVSFELIPCDPDYADTALFCRRYGYTEQDCGNTILVASKRKPIQYAACVVQGSERLDVNKKVRGLMSVSRVSFASADQTIQKTGMMIGGVTPFALPNTLPIYVDDKIMQLEYVIMGSGSRSSKIKISPNVFMHIGGAEIINGLSENSDRMTVTNRRSE